MNNQRVYCMTMIRYYVSGNTAEGFKNMLATNVDGMKQKIFVQHPSNTLKTYLFNHIVEKYKPPFDVEVFCSSKGKQYIEGLVIRNKSLAVMDATLNDGNFPDALQVNMEEVLKDNEENIDISEIMQQENELTNKAHKQLEKGLAVHDDLEAIYIQEMDFKLADQLIEQFISDQVDTIPIENTASHVYHRMFGTNTADGAVNVISELIHPISKRYILKGRAGTGKSFFMKRVAKACEERGLDLELYHCSFDPSSIDMVLVRDDFCIMDGTPPHKMFPSRVSDVVIDLYDKTVTPGTDEKYASSIEQITKEYKSYVKDGLNLLKQADGLHSEKETYYVQRLTKEVKDKAIQKLMESIY